MIYLVTTNNLLPNNDTIKIVSVEESLKYLEPLQLVGLDTETTGLDCWTKDLLSIQLGCRDFQVVVDCKTIDVSYYKEYLESDRLFIGWNLKFDLKFLYRKFIIPKNVYDGYLAEKMQWVGYPSGMHSLSLKDRFSFTSLHTESIDFIPVIIFNPTSSSDIGLSSGTTFSHK